MTCLHFKRIPIVSYSLWSIALGMVATYSLMLFSNGTFVVFGNELLDETFDSMLQHMLGFDVGVSPDAIQFESFSRNGKTYSYFGVVPALLRLPALVFMPNPEEMHLARLSCVLAGTALVGLMSHTVLIAHASIKPAARSKTLLAAVLIGVAFSGIPIYTASAAYVYNEPVLWGTVLVAWFNLVIVRAVTRGRHLSTFELCLLAILASLALNTRPTAGVDLLACFGLIMAWYALARVRSNPEMPNWSALILSGLIMAGGVLVVGAINQARWGNPLIFADYTQSDILNRYPERLDKFLKDGTLNLGRVPISALYYFTGLPYIFKYSGALGVHLQSFYDVIEGPPSSPFLTGPLWTLLATVGFGSMLRRGPVVIATFLGHVLASFLLLAAIALTLRYRADFAGLLGLSAVFGYIVISGWLSECAPSARRQAIVIVVTLCAGGIVGSHYVLVMAKILTPAVPVAVRCALQPLAPFIPVNMAAALPVGCRGTP